jgi:hypothetical protein
MSLMPSALRSPSDDAVRPVPRTLPSASAGEACAAAALPPEPPPELPPEPPRGGRARFAAIALLALSCSCAPEAPPGPPAAPPAPGSNGGDAAPPPAPSPALERGASTAGEEAPASDEPSGSDPDRAAFERGGQPSPPADLAVDRERQELSIPCLFVNPRQRLEVFACHRSGPLHETVVAFSAEGEALYKACGEIGLRSPDRFWDAVGENSVRRTLGDRVLVFLRWERGGQRFFVPAEALLRESDTGFRPWVRGFSFTLGPRRLRDGSAEKVPPAVEFTIGDPHRQGSVTSIFFHPNDLEAVTPWMAFLETDPEALPELAELVDAAAPCTLVVRRVRGEEDLLAQAKAFEKDPKRSELLDRLLPKARRIDEIKARHEARLSEIRALLDRGLEAETLSAEARAGVAAKLEPLVREGELEALRLHLTYLEYFDLQEAFRAESIASNAGLDPRLRALATLRYRQGFAYEPKLAAIDVAVAELRSKAPALGERDAWLVEAFDADKQRLDRERIVHWAEFELQEVRLRLDEFKAAKDEFRVELFAEDEKRIGADLRRLRGEIAALQSVSEEKRLRAGGDWEAKQGPVLDRRAWAEKQIELADLDLKLIEALQELRWLRNDDAPHAAGADDPQARRQTLEKTARELEARIGDLKKALGER